MGNRVSILYLWFEEAALWGPGIRSGVGVSVHQIILAKYKFKQIYVAQIPRLPGAHVSEYTAGQFS